MCGYNKNIISGAGVPPSYSLRSLFGGLWRREVGFWWAARPTLGWRRRERLAANGMGVPPGAPHRGEVGAALAFRLAHQQGRRRASVKGTPVLRWPALALLRSLLRGPASGPSLCL